MSKFGEELIESMQQAAAHAGGRKVPGVRVTTVKIPDVKAIRKVLHMSQHRFAALYRIPLPTLKNWEQGRRAPDAPVATARPRRSARTAPTSCSTLPAVQPKKLCLIAPFSRLVPKPMPNFWRA